MSLGQAPPPPAGIAPHPTAVEAKVLSVRLLKNLVELSSEKADLGEDSTTSVKLYLVRLQVLTARAVTAGDLTSVQEGTVEASTLETVDDSLVGKKIKGVIEERGDTHQHTLFLTKLEIVTAKEEKRDKSNRRINK